MRTEPAYVTGTMTVAQDGMSFHGSAMRSAVVTSSTALMTVSSCEVGPGGRARLTSAATATTAKAPSRALSRDRQNGVL
jgi:hypothetical protein